MSRLDVNVGSGQLARRGFGRGFLFAVWFSLSLAVGGGCKHQTTAQLVDAEIKKRRAAEANLTTEEAEAARKEADEELEKYTRDSTKRELQRARDVKRNDALTAIDSEEWNEALKLVKQIYDEMNPVEKTIELADGSKKTITIEPPPIEDPEKARLFVIVGTAYYSRGSDDADTEKAIQAFRQATKLDPELKVARRNFGKLLFGNRDYRQAIEVFEEELATGLHDAELLFLVAQARYELFYKEGQREPGQREAARIAMERVLVERPLDEEVMRWLAFLNVETRRYDEAIRLLEAILNAHPFSSEYNQMLASAYREKGEYAKALERLEIAARFEPPGPDMCRSLSDLYASQNLPEDAAIWLERAYVEDPGEMKPEDHLYAGQLYADAGKIDASIAHLQSIKDSEPQYPGAQSQLAWLFEDLGRDEDALAAYANVARARPQDGQAHLAAADIYLARKDLEKAFDAYARAAALPKSKADGLAGLAEVAYEKDDLEDAIKHYQEALEERPKDPRFMTALREISTQLEIRKRQAD